MPVRLTRWPHVDVVCHFIPPFGTDDDIGALLGSRLGIHPRFVVGFANLNSARYSLEYGTQALSEDPRRSASNKRNGSLDEKLARLLGDEWQTAAQVQRLSGGDTLEVAKALDRLWGAGRIDRQTDEISIGARRKSGGGQFRRLKYRRKAMKA